MPNHIEYYMVRMVNLVTGQFEETEMSSLDLDAFELMNKTKGDIYQIINKKYLRTKNLI